MTTIALELNKKNHGEFFISENGQILGEMSVSRKDDILTIYHTMIKPQAKGKGFGQKLFDNMIQYAEEEKLMIRPICPFVHSMFDKDPERYSAIWIKAEY